MAIVSFLISLAGATMLLLFAVRMVRTGIERSFGTSFQRLLTSQESAWRASIVGLVLAVILQSATAVALLSSGFAAGGMISFAMGLAIVLGADLGSALVIQILTFQLDWLVPLLLAIGGYLFVKTETRKNRQFGRILLGIAFVLISLRFLREAMDPIRDSAFLPAIATYLAEDFVTAFIVGASLAFVMHSSVAAILMCVTLVQIGALPFDAGVSVLLGANFGAGFIPIWLSRGMSAEARRIPMANVMLRGGLALAALLAINLGAKQANLMPEGSGQMLVSAHLAFNAILLVLGLPFCSALELPARWMTGDDPKGDQEDEAASSNTESVLNDAMMQTGTQAVAGLKRETLRMFDLVEAMFQPSLSLYETGDKTRIRAVRAKDEDVNNCLEGIRKFVANLPMESFSKAQTKDVRDMMEYAIRLETAGDVIARRLAVLADQKRRKNVQFSKEGWGELRDMHESIRANIRLAATVLLSDDLESARILSLEKSEIKRAERKSRKRHLRRLQAGRQESFDTSDIHLETLRAFREFNSHISAVAYPILYRQGQLLETRLIEQMSQSADATS